MIEGFIYELFSCFMENMAISVVKFSSKAGIQKLTNFDPKLIEIEAEFRGMTSPQKLVNFDIQQLILKSSCLFKSSSIVFSSFDAFKEHFLFLPPFPFKKKIIESVYFRQKSLIFYLYLENFTTNTFYRNGESNRYII